jgi:hypothetical protein
MPDTKRDMLNEALAYASKFDWPVFPVHSVCDSGDCSCGNLECANVGKHPRTPNGFKDATTNPEQIRAWWTKHPRANIGIATGPASGFDALDIDPRNGGDESLEELEEKHGKLPDTVEQITGGGGRHILLLHGDGMRTKSGVRPGLDLKADRGYIVAPPSIHASRRPYEWELSSRPGEVKMADHPAWLLSLLKQDNGKLPDDGIGDVIPEGKRNATLASVAGMMRRPGMSKSAIEAALLVENKTRCKPPLPDNEVIRIADSIGSYPPSVSIVSEIDEGLQKSEWPMPQALPDGLPPVERFRFELLPAKLCPWIEDIVTCPPRMFPVLKLGYGT